MSDGGMQKPAAQYMRGIATEARAWTARTLAPAGSGSNNGGKPKHGERVDPVTMLLLVDAGDQRVGGPSGRGPLLRRLQQPAPGAFVYQLTVVREVVIMFSIRAVARN